MKNIILTIDYEIFLQSNIGTVNSTMIDPTEKLLNILAKLNGKMTVFWDILHFYRLIELEDQYPEIKKDRIAIENQILKMVEQGHDIQLHLHPHWLNTKYINGKWKFNLKNFKLHSLSKENNPYDINTILGCVTISVKLLEKIIKKVDKNYKVFAFRAGGYLIEPFNEIKDALLCNGIYIDSSVCPELQGGNKYFSYNFKNYPKERMYKFSSNLKKRDNKGNFIEIPITSQKVPLILRIIFAIYKRYKYINIEQFKKERDHVTSQNVKKSITNKIYKFFNDKKYLKLTTDSSFKEKYNYLLKKAKDNSTQILHPKMLNNHNIKLIEMQRNKINFITIKEFVYNNKLNQSV